MRQRPEWMDDSDWQVCQSEIDKFGKTVVLYTHGDELFLIYGIELWWWDPVDGCFMPAEQLS